MTLLRPTAALLALAATAACLDAPTAPADGTGAIHGRISLAAGEGADVALSMAFTGGAAAPALPSAGLPAPDAGALDRGLVVTFRPAAADGDPSRLRDPAAAAEAARRLRGRIEARIGAAEVEVSPTIGAARVRLPRGADPAAAARALRADPRVAAVTPDLPVRALGASAPADPFYRAQAWHLRMAGLPRAWRRTVGRAEVTVAVVDDGVRFDHPAVAAALTRDGYDFVPDDAAGCGGAAAMAGDGDGYDSDPSLPAAADGCGAQDGFGGHGLAVAALVGAAGDDGVGTAGAAWRVRVRPVRVLDAAGSAGHFDLAQAILYAAGLPASDGRGGVVQAPSPARIVNLSLGSPASSPALREAVRLAAESGALLVAAAGNGGDGMPVYPAAYPEVLAVAAVGPDGRAASYSTRGDWVDLAAPGGDPALGDATAQVFSAGWDFAAGRAGYGWFVGTSMAAAHVSGAAALLLSAEPGLDAAALRARLVEHARDAGAPGPDPAYGAGLLDAAASLAGGAADDLVVRVHDARTGEVVREEPASGGRFSVEGLPAGAYLVAGGERTETAAPGAPWGRWGVAGAPTEVRVGAGGSVSADVVAAFAEREPNDAAGGATPLLPGVPASGRLSSAGDVDLFAVDLPAGRWTFETEGALGSCGLALDADTELTLLDAAGAPLARSGHADPARWDYCSRVTRDLPAGRYLVRVAAEWDRPGGYALRVRAD